MKAACQEKQATNVILMRTLMGGALLLLVEMDGAEGVAVFNIIENLALLFIFLYELIGKTAQPIFSAFFAECNYGELHRI